ncbi:MAG: diguanylate cyclase [Magnetococcales bacterium]|nr:diguanylate cyclase [Magnetococcales bacterium]
MKTVGAKIISVVGGVAFLSLVGLIAFYTYHHEQSLLEQNRTNRLETVDSVIQGLDALMLAGSAGIAQSYADSLQNVTGFEDLRILRTDGHEAYRDNQTVMIVNWNRGEDVFTTRLHETSNRIIKSDDVYLKQMLKTQETVSFHELGNHGEDALTFLTPIKNQKSCHHCHGKDEDILGAVKLTTSLNTVNAAIRDTRMHAIWVLAISLSLLLALTYLLIRSTVIRPIQQVTHAMRQLTDGDLTQNIPVPGSDEISTMARCFNTMGRQLLNTYTGLQHEQNKLTTIILSAREGIVVTDSKRHIVLANPSAERLLEKRLEEIVTGGLLNLFNNPSLMQKLLIAKDEDSHHTVILLNGRHLSIYASVILSPQGKEIGSAAMIRDITEEKRLETHLRNLSYMDELTQLLNRRRMDELLTREAKLAKRHNAELTVIMFDVDHFKKFNDDHGHDQGDRVLTALGVAMKQCFRETDFCCRYGGEEFCVILPNTDLEGGRQAAEELRRHIEQMLVDGLTVTISLGVASMKVSEYPDPNVLIKLADNALYIAKKEGRNRVREAS